MMLDLIYIKCNFLLLWFIIQAVPHGRREANDSFNDETFGSSEFTSEDRAEEERKRRGERLFSYLADFLTSLVDYFLSGWGRVDKGGAGCK